MRTGSVYVLIDPLTEEIRYVGVTTRDHGERLRAHFAEIRRVKPSGVMSHRLRWLAKLQRLGLVPRMETVQVLDVDSVFEAEKYWIAHFIERGCRLTNSTSGGEGVVGYDPPDEVRARMRVSAAERMRRDGSPFKGRHHTPEAKAKLSAATNRQFADPAARAAVSRVHKGKTISEAQKRAVSEAATRRWDAVRRGEQQSYSDEGKRGIRDGARRREARKRIAQGKPRPGDRELLLETV